MSIETWWQHFQRRFFSPTLLIEVRMDDGSWAGRSAKITKGDTIELDDDQGVVIRIRAR